MPWRDNGNPSTRRGTLVLWMPMPQLEADGTLDVKRAANRFGARAFDFQIALERLGLGLPTALAIPSELGADAIAGAKTAMLAQAPELSARAQIVLHGPSSSTLGEVTDDHQTWLLFLDSTGVLRAAESFYTGKQLDGGLRRWIDVFRNR